MADLDSIKSELLQRDGCYIESLDGKQVFRVKDLSQEGKYHLVYQWSSEKEDDTSKPIPFSFTVEIDSVMIRYSMELLKDYMDCLHLASKKDGEYYLPSREMCQAMPITCEIMFYSNPGNLNTSFDEYMTGEEDHMFWGDELDWPKYRFDEDDCLAGCVDINDVGTIPSQGIDLSDLLSLGEKVLMEAKAMADYFMLRMLPEMKHISPFLKKQYRKLLLETGGKILRQGLFKATASEMWREIKEIIPFFGFLNRR